MKAMLIGRAALITVFTCLALGFARSEPTPLMNPPSPLLSFGDPQLPADGWQKWMSGVNGSTVQDGNVVTQLIDAGETFEAMKNAIETARNSDHFIYILGWFLKDDFRIRPGYSGTTMAELLQAASDRGVEVKAMLWDQRGTQNDAEVAHINALTNGAAILDNRTLNIGSHHQKIVVVFGNQGLISFCGGIDINPDRLYPRGVGPNVDGDTSGAPLNDIHCRIQGPSAYDFVDIFKERWNDHPARLALPAAKQTLKSDSITRPAAINGATMRVQTGRTYGNGSAHRGIDSSGFPYYTPRGYTFAARGARQPANMILRAIGAARKSIYIEDQYFVDTAPNTAGLDVRAALVAALPNIDNLIIIIPHADITPLETDVSNSQTLYRRSLLINALRAAGGNKVRVFNLSRPTTWEHCYVHSKTWIFDDEFAIIGSANCNRRSWTHDSEVAAGIWDRGKSDRSKLYFAHELRMKLWSKYLNVDDYKSLLNPLTAKTWFDSSNLPWGSFLEEYDYTQTPGPPTNANYFWDTFIDPDGS